MNYKAQYDKLITKAQNRLETKGYTERHHVVPRCLGGSDDKTNMVTLTAREHCLAHLLLAKIHGGGLWAAVHMMLNMHTPNSRAYKVAREKHAQFMSDIMAGEGNHMFGKKGNRAPFFGKKHSETTKNHWSEIRTGRKQSQETIAKRVEKITSDKNPNFLGAITATNKLTGESFTLIGEKNIISAGFSAPKVYMCVNGKRKSHKGFTFTR